MCPCKLLVFLLRYICFLEEHWCVSLQFQDTSTASSIASLDGLKFFDDSLKMMLLPESFDAKGKFTFDDYHENLSGNS